LNAIGAGIVDYLDARLLKIYKSNGAFAEITGGS
jgi:hypothetical protein